jgi:hypothetical protein
MSKNVNVVSALHGHHMSLSFATNSAERGWYVGVSPEGDYEVQDDEIIDPEDTLPFAYRVNHPVVSDLLARASTLDLTRDQPYMPMANTNLLEATSYLGTTGSVGIKGAILRFDERTQTISVALLGSSNSVVLNWQEVVELLRANYPVE